MAIPQNTRFLVAEDDHLTRGELVTNLRDLGFTGEVLEAENGRDAYSLFINQMIVGEKVGFIISDMVMPVFTGYDLLVQVRKDKAYQEIPFLMLTSKNDREAVLKSAKAKVSNYLIKPWNLQMLGEKLHGCWKKHHPN
ncbi:MAG: response regulator [Bacteriovoracaceae bacterium]